MVIKTCQKINNIKKQLPKIKYTFGIHFVTLIWFMSWKNLTFRVDQIQFLAIDSFWMKNKNGSRCDFIDLECCFNPPNAFYFIKFLVIKRRLSLDSDTLNEIITSRKTLSQKTSKSFNLRSEIYLFFFNFFIFFLKKSKNIILVHVYFSCWIPEQKWYKRDWQKPFCLEKSDVHQCPFLIFALNSFRGIYFFSRFKSTDLFFMNDKYIMHSEEKTLFRHYKSSKCRKKVSNISPFFYEPIFSFSLTLSCSLWHINHQSRLHKFIFVPLIFFSYFSSFLSVFRYHFVVRSLCLIHLMCLFGVFVVASTK